MKSGKWFSHILRQASRLPNGPDDRHGGFNQGSKFEEKHLRRHVERCTARRGRAGQGGDGAGSTEFRPIAISDDFQSEFDIDFW